MNGYSPISSVRASERNIEPAPVAEIVLTFYSGCRAIPADWLLLNTLSSLDSNAPLGIADQPSRDCFSGSRNKVFLSSPSAILAAARVRLLLELMVSELHKAGLTKQGKTEE